VQRAQRARRLPVRRHRAIRGNGSSGTSSNILAAPGQSPCALRRCTTVRMLRWCRPSVRNRQIKTCRFVVCGDCAAEQRSLTYIAHDAFSPTLRSNHQIDTGVKHAFRRQSAHVDRSREIGAAENIGLRWATPS